MTPLELKEELDKKKGNAIHSESVKLLVDGMKRVWEVHYANVLNNAFTYDGEEDDTT